jgi:peroxiredoxin
MRVFIILFFAAFSLAGYSQEKMDGFTIAGKVNGMNGEKIYLAAFTINGSRDSAVVEKGLFQFAGKIAEPTPYILSLERNFVNKPLLLFFAGNGQIHVDVNKDDIVHSRITGPAATKDYAVYAKVIEPFNDQIHLLSDYRKSVDKTNKPTLDSIATAWDAIVEKRKKEEIVFIKAHPNSVVSAWIITRSFIYQPDLVQLQSLYDGLSPKLSTTSYIKQIKEKLDVETRFAPGQFAADFSQADTLGKMVSLKDFKGKYVLLDFWASWCVPCRAENPNVVAAYNKYKDKNFTVLSVSLDRPDKKDAWLAAIHKDGLTWTHVSDLKFWDNEVAKLYGINSVPSNFLVDPAGKIVAKNLSGEQLQEKLKEIIK